jgi:hypothetical protein
VSGQTASFLWTQVDPLNTVTALTEPTVSLDNSAGKICSFVVPLADISGSTLVFRLTVTNSTGSDSDLIMVTILDNGIAGFPPDTLSFFSSTGAKLALKAGANCTVKNIYTEEPDAYDPAKRPDKLIYGIIQCDFKAIAASELISYTVYLPAAASSLYHWFKYVESEDSWIDFDRTKISGGTGEGAVFNQARTEVTIYLKDESAYDSDPEDSKISDTCGLGTSLPEKKEKDDAFSGCFVKTVSP